VVGGPWGAGFQWAWPGMHELHSPVRADQPFGTFAAQLPVDYGDEIFLLPSRGRVPPVLGSVFESMGNKVED
jgi:hypothetical protein